MGDAAIRVIQAFRHADLDGNGVISKAELLEVLGELAPGKWNESKVEKLMQAIDTNGDGLVQYEEFIAFLFDKSPSDWGSAKKQLGKGASRRDSMKIVKPAEVIEDQEEGEEESKVAVRRKADGFGRILVFFDVDGVLNSTGSFDDSDEDGEEEEDEDAENEDTVSDELGRWAARLSRRCLTLFRLLLRSFDEREDAGPNLVVLNPEDPEAKEAEQPPPKPVEDPNAPRKNRVRLVLTSTWRFSEDQTAFIRRALVEAGISEEVFLGGTAVMAGASRSEEIMHYIGEMHTSGKDVAAWVAIDSDPENLAVLPEANQVRTWEVAGLQRDNVVKARQLLIAQDTAWLSLRKLPPPGYPDEFEFDKKKKKDKGGKKETGGEGGDGEKPVGKTKSHRRGSCDQGGQEEKPAGKSKSVRQVSHDQGDDGELPAAPRRGRRASTVPSLEITLHRSRSPPNGGGKNLVSHSASASRRPSLSPSPGSSRMGPPSAGNAGEEPPSSGGAEGSQRKGSKRNRRASLEVSCAFPQASSSKEEPAKPRPRPASASVLEGSSAKPKAGRRKSAMVVPEGLPSSLVEEPSPKPKASSSSKRLGSPERPHFAAPDQASSKEKAMRRRSLFVQPSASEEPSPEKPATGRRKTLAVVNPPEFGVEAPAAKPRSIDEPAPKSKGSRRRSTAGSPSPSPRPDGACPSSGCGDKAGASTSDDALGNAKAQRGKGSKSPLPGPGNPPSQTPSKSPSPRPDES